MKKFLPLLLLVALHLFFLINLQFTAWPEMTSYAYLFNNGFKLYSDMAYPYPPLLVLELSVVFKLFGYKLLALKIFTWALIIANDILIYLIARQFTKRSIYAISALAFYVILQPFLNGNQLWFDFAITTPILLAIYFRKRFLLAGLFLALAFLTKQTALVFLAVFFLWSRSFKSLIPVILMVLIFVTCLFLGGQLTDYYNWNFYYPFAYWTKYPSYQILSLTKREIVSMALILIPSLFLFFKSRKPVVLFLFLLAGIIAIYPRFSFYHFQPTLAIASVIFGVFLQRIKVPAFLLVFFYFLLFLLISVPVIKTEWQKDARFWAQSDLDFAKMIKSSSGTVYFLGPHSGYYVMSGKLPPKPWIDNFGWYFELPGVQEKVIDSWKESPPDEIFIQNQNPGKWYEIGVYQPQKIKEWISINYNRQKEVKTGIWLLRKK